MSTLAASRQPLTVHTCELDDDRDLLAHLPGTAPLAWVRHGAGLVGWGEAARFTLPPERHTGASDRFSAAARWLGNLFEPAHVHDEVEMLGTGPVAFGSFTFDPDSPGSTLVVPRVIVGRREGRSWITRISNGSSAHPRGLPTAVTPVERVGRLRWSGGALSARQWGRAVSAAVRRIQAGELAKAVLAFDRFAYADGPIDVRALLTRLAADFPDCYTFSVAGLVGATPELLIRREGDAVTSLVLAGTRARGTTTEDDEKLAAELTGSVKDREEHRYAIESLRQTLAPLSSAIETPDIPGLLRLANLQHLASPARATLLPGASTLDVVAAMHPTAAVGGTPTDAALGLIAELEHMDRGRYAGPVGWIDAQGNGEWGIALRSAEIAGERARLFAGCGIVAGSEPEAEIAEAETKFRVMRGALEG